MNINDSQNEKHLQQFDELARSIAEEIAKTELSDEELEIRFEATRKRLHDKLRKSAAKG